MGVSYAARPCPRVPYAPIIATMSTMFGRLASARHPAAELGTERHSIRIVESSANGFGASGDLEHSRREGSGGRERYVLPSTAPS